MFSVQAHRIKVLFTFLILTTCTLTVLAEDPNMPQQVEQWQQTAKTAVQSKDYALAEQQYKNIIQWDPDSPFALNAQKSIVIMYINASQSSKADAALAETYSKFADADGLMQTVEDIGRSLRQKKQHSRAIEVYREVLSKYPSDKRAIWIQGALVQACSELKDRASVDAEYAVLQKQYKQDPAYVEVVSKRALIYKKRFSSNKVG